MILRKTKFTSRGIDLVTSEGDLENLIDEICSFTGDKETSFELREGGALRFEIAKNPDSSGYEISFRSDPSISTVIAFRGFSLVEAANLARTFFADRESIRGSYECHDIALPPGGQELADGQLADLFQHLGPEKKPWWKFWG